MPKRKRCRYCGKSFYLESGERNIAGAWKRRDSHERVCSERFVNKKPFNLEFCDGADRLAMYAERKGERGEE